MMRKVDTQSRSVASRNPISGYAPGIFNIFPNGFNIFPNGFNKGPYILIFFKGC